MRTALLILALLLAAAGCATTSQSGSGADAVASDFTLPTTDGTPFTLSEHVGKKAILINFWATWCTPCAYELPHLQALHDKYKDQGLLVVSVAMDGPETVANVGPFVRRHNLTFPVVLDEETRAVAVFNPRRSAPFNVFIDKAGRIVGSREGFNLGDEKAIEQTVLSMLAPGSAPTAQPVPASAPAGGHAGCK